MRTHALDEFGSFRVEVLYTIPRCFDLNLLIQTCTTIFVDSQFFFLYSKIIGL